MKQMHLPHTEQMLLTFAFAILVGCVLQDYPAVVNNVCKPLESFCFFVFKLFIIPMMMLSISSTLVSFRRGSKARKLVGAAFGFFVLTTVAAVSLALVMSALMSEVYPVMGGTNLRLPEPLSSAEVLSGVLDIMLSNLGVAVALGSVLTFVIIAFVLGLVLPFLLSRRQTINFLHKTDRLLGGAIGYFWRFAPVGMFVILVPSVASYGSEMVGEYASLIGVCIMCFILQWLVVYLPCLYWLGKVNPMQFLSSMARPLIFAIASESSILTLPYNVRSVTLMGVRKEVSRLVLPLGTTFNMDGSSIYLVASTVVMASYYGIDLTFVQYLLIGILAVITSFGIVGVPGASLTMMPLIFLSVGIPVEAVGAVAVVDRLIDMGCTMVSVSGDAACAVVLDRKLKKAF